MKKILLILIVLYFPLHANKYNNPLQGNAPELYKLINKKDYENVTKLLEKGTSPTLAMKYKYNGIVNYDTAIGYALRTSDVKMVKIFLFYINDINMPRGMYKPLLFSPILSENNKVIKFLIDNGSDINFRSKYNLRDTAVEFAVIREKFNSAQYLLELGAKFDNEDGMKLLNFAVKPLKLKSLEFLIKNKIDLNYQDEKGNTIMHLIAMKIIDKNLENSIKYVNESGYLKKVPGAYKMAIKSIEQIKSRWINYPKIVELLIKSGINLNLKNKQGKTPLLLAKEYKNKIVLGILSINKK